MCLALGKGKEQSIFRGVFYEYVRITKKGKD